MKYSRSPNYEHNNKNYTYTILNRLFDIKDDNTLFINLYGNSKISIKGNIIEAYEPTYNDLDRYTIHINQDDICISKQQNQKDLQEYVRSLIYNSRLYSFQVLCKSHSILQLFYSKLTDDLINKLSRYTRSYNYFGGTSNLFLVASGFLELYLCLNSTRPFIRIRGVDFSFTDDRFVEFLEKFI